MRVSFILIEFILINIIIISDNSSLFHSTQNQKNNGICIYKQPYPLKPLTWDDPLFLYKFDSLTIQFKRAGKLLMVEANIDGQLGNLIFDTGASGLVLNKTYFRDFIQSESTSPSGITGSLGKVYRTIVDSLKVNGLLYHNIKADLAELGHIENRRGVKVLGLFGFSLIRNFEIFIDIQNNELKLMPIDKKGNRLNGSINNLKMDYTQEAKVENSILFVLGEIGGKSLRFCFDTGAEINVISSSEQKKVLNTISITRRSKIGGADSSETEVLYGSMNDFSLGGNKLDNMQTIIANLSSLEEGYGVPFSGVLGYDLLEKGIICINLRKQQFGIRFTKAERI